MRDVAREERSIEVERGVALTVDLYGPDDGAPVLLLHGFPQSAFAWRGLAPILAARGMRCIAPDQRGYDRSDKPSRVRDYREERLVEDLVAVADALGHRRLSIVAHDWGGVLGWRLAATYPEMVERLVVLNGPHPDRYRELALEQRDPEQMRRSIYIYFFQLPFLPEAALTRPGQLARTFRSSSVRPEVFTDEVVAHYESAIRKPGAVRGMLAWYRATMRYPPPRLPKVKADTLVLWGDRDEAMSPKLAEDLGRFVEGGLSVVHFPDASHWIVDERCDEVAREILAFLR